MPYLNLDLDYFTHPKVRRLVNQIGPLAPLYLLKLWCYAGRHFPVTGVLEGCSKHEIEHEVGWDGEEGRFVDMLVNLSLLDVKKTEKESENFNYRIHDWKQHAGHLWAFKKRAKTAAKKRWDSYASSKAESNAKGCAPNLTYPKDTNTIKSKPSTAQLSDIEFIAELRLNPAYAHIDLDRELGRMDAWLLTHPGRQKTKRFIVNWLNKIDAPMASSHVVEKKRTLVV